MAGAASCSSSSSSKGPYDVFLSFRGEDTRRHFVCHLDHALRQKGITTYKDDRTLEKGDEVWPALQRAIENSHLCIVVLSKDYAGSTWCLRELTHILECKKENLKQVIPVFYQIDPTHVRKQTGSYKVAFDKHEAKSKQLIEIIKGKRKSKYDKETIKKWKATLQKVAGFSGFNTAEYGDDIQLIKDIIKDVWEKLQSSHASSTKLEGLVGIDKSIADLEELLRKSQTIGLWGMGGIGKTTIAKALYKKYSNSSRYTGHCFLKDIREDSSKLESLREQLLKELFKGDNIHINIESGFFKSKLKSKIVFIVLDNVNAFEQIDHLIEEEIGPSSRIIITTRDRNVLNARVDKIYEVKGLDFDESLRLFNLNAFRAEHHPTEFEELSKQVVKYTQGLPLALKLLGSFLRGTSKEKWECILTNLKEDPHEPIDKVLKWSYEELNQKQQKIFLDIAFFFKGEAKDDVEKFLDACNINVARGLEDLKDKALITISNEGVVEMHDLIQEMGWKRVQEMCEDDPERRSRLRNPKEISTMLENNTESDLIEGIIFDMSKGWDLQFSASSFKKMINLRFLKFYNPLWNPRSCKVYGPSHVELISHKLSYFQWDACPLQSLPSTFCPKKLVELRMPQSHVEKLWDEVQDTVNLRVIDLRGSKNLIKFPSLSNSSNLKKIDLSRCEKLRCVDLSNSPLPKLVYLDLSHCLELESLLGRTPLESLKHLHVEGCSSLKEFSLSSEEIIELNLSKTAIKRLSSSIGRCSKLKRLYLPDSLEMLPNELSKLRFLQKLVVGNAEFDTRNSHNILDGGSSTRLYDEETEVGGSNLRSKMTTSNFLQTT